MLIVLGLAGTFEPIVQAVTSSSASAQPNLIENGGFTAYSIGDGTNDGGFIEYPGGSISISNWTVGGDSVDLTFSSHWQEPPAAPGSLSVDLAGSQPGSLSQTVATTPGETYTLSWDMAGNPDGGTGVKTMAVFWNGAVVDEPSFDVTNAINDQSMGWQGEQVNVTATASSTTVEFADASTPQSAYGAVLGNVSLLPTTGTVTTSLTTSSPTVAGVETVPASVVPASTVGNSSGDSGGDAASAPLDSIPLDSISLASSPLDSIPLDSIPLDSIATPSDGDSAIAADQAALESALLSDIGISFPQGCGASSSAPVCTGWEGVLAGSKYAGLPLESVTLADVLTDSVSAGRFDSVDLGALDLASSPLDSIPLDSIELGATPLSSIDLPGASDPSSALAAWCTELSSLGYKCSEFGINYSSSPPGDNGATLLSLALAGVPLDSIPLDSIPLDSISLASSPLDSIPLDLINLAANPLDSIPLDSIPLESIPLDSIPLDSIGDLSSVCVSNSGFSCSTASEAGDTLGQASSADAIPATATLADLSSYNGTTLGELLTGDITSTSGYPTLTLADLLLSTVPPASYPWPSVDLSGLPLASDESAGGTVDYTATLDVSGAPSTVLVSVTLPPTFAYVPNTTTLCAPATLNCASAPNPTIATSLTWALQLPIGSSTLTFAANAGIDLGPATTTLSASVGGTLNSSSSATVDVIDGEAPTVNSALPGFPLVPGTPPANGGSLYIGYLTSQGDLNDWSVTVPQNDELSLALTNLPATYDLELFGPGTQQLQGTPTQDLPGVADTLPSIAPDVTTEATPGSQDLAITPPAGDQLEALSNNPDGQSQYIQTPPLAAGTYIVQVSGYNGAFSSQPYLLQANMLGGETAPSCPDGISYLSDLTSGTEATPPSDLDTNIPSNVNTLFLVNTQRLEAAFGNAFDDSADPSQQTIVTDLNEIAADTQAGVVGAVIPVDSYQSVQTAYASWNANPCSVEAANGVVAAISSEVDQLRAQYPTIQNVVIVGADDQIPFARIADGATQSNERDYGASSFAGENNPEADALSLGYYLSDDPYGANSPLGVGSATLYTPQVAVGRLVESAGEIESALTRFVSSGGDLDANSSLTTGYSFLTSGAEAVSANLAANGLTASDLINDTWQESDLDSALAGNGESGGPTVDSINAHFDYSRALPAYDNTYNLTTNLFTTTDVRDALSSYSGRLLFSMGCHAGLDVDDAEVSTSGVTTPVDDWAKTFADAGALWIANTGYGYADTDTIAYSAKLMAEFAANLNGSLTIGEALAEAKQQYAAGNAILSPYDLKALMESTFYGLPMYTLNGSSTPVAPTNGPATTIDGATGLAVAGFSVSLQQGTDPGELSLETSGNGSYYQVNGASASFAGTQATEYRPIEPLVTVPETEPGLIPHGALVSGLSSADTADFTPAYSMPAAGSADATPPAIGDAAFPGTLQRVATYGTFTKSGTGTGAQLDLIAGQFLPDPSSPGMGTERVFSSIAGQVYYTSPSSPYANDFTPATIDSSQAVLSDGKFDLSVQVTPSAAPVAEVLVLYTDGSNPGTWSSVNLSSTDGHNWTAAVPSTSSGNVQYFVEAVDDAGNVAVSNNEGTAFNAATQTAISIALSGNGPTNGYYTGAVTATITAPSGSNYVLDGSAPTLLTGPVVVTATGEHTLTVTAPNGNESTTQAFAISTSQTSTTLSSGTSSLVVGQQVTLTAAVAALSSGLSSSPTGNVVFLDGTSPIAACGGTTGEGLTGGLATCQASFSSIGTHQITASYVSNDGFATSTSSAVGLSVSLRSATVSSFTVMGSPTTYGAESGLSFTATVTAGDSDPFPSGDQVTVSQGSTTLCTITLSNLSGNSGTGSCSPMSNTVLQESSNPYTVTATFDASGDDQNFLAAAPATTTVTVEPGSASVSSFNVTGSPVYGGETNLSFSASVTGGNGVSIPSGDTVSVTYGSTNICTFKLSSGSCSPTSGTALPVGNDTVTATFNASGADSDFGATASATTSVAVTADSATVSSFNVTGSPVYGGETNLSFSASVTGGNGVSVPSGDTVSVTYGSTNICTFKLSSGSCSPTSATALPAGNDTVTATFNASGADSDFVTTASATTSVTVNQAGTTTSLKLSTTTATYGSEQLVVFTSTVSPQLAGTPSGKITIKSGSTALCTITLPSTSCSTTADALAAAVSPYSITAAYGGDSNFTGSTSSSVLMQVFSQSCITTSLTGPLTISKGQVICMASGGRVTGPVTISTGGGLWTSGGTISGPLSSTGAIGIVLCGSTVTGAVSITGSTGAVQIGGSGCTGDTITGSVTMTGNGAGASFDGNHLTGALNVSNNAGGVAITGNTQTGSGTVSSNTGGVVFTNNKMVGSLVITNNSGGFTYSGNSISGSVTKTGNQ
jgi:choice-of-anchor C domain-containing protein